MDLTALTLTETLKLLTAKKVSVLEVTQAYWARIRALDERIGSFLFLNQQALQERTEQAGALAGVPLGIKDNFCTKGLPTTAASKFLQGYAPPYDATAVQKLQAAGATLLGKLNLDEFAMGASTENSAMQLTRNPWNLKRVPGGSSGGSAAAVAADFCVAALGSDTGGSIRQPASFCSVVGLKPTYGRISRSGLIALASSLDTVGVLTKSVQDAALLLGILAGPDQFDATTSPKPVPNYLASLEKEDLKGVRIGLPQEYFAANLNPAVKEVILRATKVLAAQGAELIEVSLPHTEFAVATYYLIMSSEASANLARYDGVRFGHQRAAENLRQTYFESRSHGFGVEVKRRIILGTFALSAGYAEEFYKKALRVRTLIARDFAKVFEQVDLLATPVAPSTAFAFGAKADPLAMYLADLFTIPMSLAGLPGISVPAGFSAGLPVGLQIVAPQFGEESLLRAAHLFEQATDFHSRKPNLEIS